MTPPEHAKRPPNQLLVRTPDGREYGPFAWERIRGWWRAGHLHWAHSIRPTESAPWKPLSDLTELLQDLPGESGSEIEGGALPPWKLYLPAKTFCHSMDLQLEMDVEVRLRLWAYSAMAAVVFVLGWTGHYFPLPGGNTWALWSGYLLSSPLPERNAGIDVSRFQPWASLFALVGLGFWPAMLARGRWLGRHFNLVATCFLLVDFGANCLLGGFAFVRAELSQLDPWIGFKVVLPAIPAAVILEGVAYFWRRIPRPDD
jgi:hypothetical protein